MIETVSMWIESTGAAVYLLAPGFTVAVAILPIPAEIPAMLNGMVFGPVWGTLVTWIAALSGAQISFELARRFGRPLAGRVLPTHVIGRADALVTSAGWPLLLGLRLLPTVAFTGLNWASGLTAMRRVTFFWTTAVGILPGAYVFTATGSGLQALLERYGGPGVAMAATALTVLGFLVLAVWVFRSPAASRSS